MAFNHYAKLAKIFESNPGCKIKKVNEPTKTKRFDGTYNTYQYYYRLIDKNNEEIKYGKFQQIDRLAKQLNISIDQLELLIIEDE